MKALSYGLGLLAVGVVTWLLVGDNFSGVTKDPAKANAAQRMNECKLIVLALEEYQKAHGTLPPSLDALQASDPSIQKLHPNLFVYNPNGVDGWLLWAPNPMDDTKRIAGRLPYDVAVVPLIRAGSGR